MSSIEKEIRKPHTSAFRRCYIKRRLKATGLFEPNWFEITDDIKKWGTIRQKVDDVRYNRFRFSGMKITAANDDGQFNEETDDNSHWSGYASTQRSLLKIEAGFVHTTLGADGIYTHVEYPRTNLSGTIGGWDAGMWGEARWDEGLGTASAAFIGIISGDIGVTGKNTVSLPVQPLVQIFRDYPAQKLTGWDSTKTASDIMTMVRDQTDGSGNYVFRPFFGDTTANWDIQTTTSVYAEMNTSSAVDVIDKTVWQVIEKIAEAENFIPYITRAGVFKFTDRTPPTATAFQFIGHGGDVNGAYGHNIKEIDNIGRKVSKYYSRIQVKFDEANTETSYVVHEAAFTVSGVNNPWNLGYRSFSLDNTWIADTATAAAIALSIFTEVSSLKREVSMRTSFVPHLELFDRTTITYDSNPTDPDSLWDQNTWADSSGAAETGAEMVWDPYGGSSIALEGTEFKMMSQEINLDKLECMFHMREV